MRFIEFKVGICWTAKVQDEKLGLCLDDRLWLLKPNNQNTLQSVKQKE